jgi:hypothetical protein
MTTDQANNIGITATERARKLVRGAYDLHVHVEPDVMSRKISDLELARRFRDNGLTGFVLKSHYVSTAERATVVRAAVPGVDVLGALALNAAVGGMNPLAVEIAAREDARVVWMPTVDALNEPAGRTAPAKDAKLPFWAKMQHELREHGIESAPVHVVDESGKLLPQTRSVLRVIARHDLVLATGHLGRDEIFAVVDAALEEGVNHIVITHPEFPSQNLSAEDQFELAQRGALLERCFTTAHTGKVPWERLFANMRAVGPEYSVLSTDLGQPTNPPVEDGLPLMADRLLSAGFSEEEVYVMAVTNSTRLAKGVMTN